MKNRFLNRLAVACCFVIASTVSASSAPLDCEPLAWRGAIYPDNKDYIKVELNAQKMPQNNYLQSVSFQFTFYDDQRRQIATEDVRFADEPAQGLDPAFYEIYLKHSYRSASSIGGNMAYLCKRKGVAFYSLKATVPIKEARWEEYPAAKDITVIGGPPGTQPSNQPSNKERAGCDYAGFWRNKDGNLSYIQFLEIVAVAPGRLQIQAWLRCSPTPAKGGTIKDCLEWGKDEVSITNFDNVIWKHDEPQELGQPPGPITRTTVTFTHSLTLDGDTLKVHVDKFGGGFNYFTRGEKP